MGQKTHPVGFRLGIVKDWNSSWFSDKAYADTYNYLVFLREAVQAFMDEGNGMEAIGSIDQSDFSRLDNFDMLSGRNAQRVYEELEWE